MWVRGTCDFTCPWGMRSNAFMWGDNQLRMQLLFWEAGLSCEGNAGGTEDEPHNTVDVTGVDLVAAGGRGDGEGRGRNAEPETLGDGVSFGGVGAAAGAWQDGEAARRHGRAMADTQLGPQGHRGLHDHEQQHHEHRRGHAELDGGDPARI